MGGDLRTGDGWGRVTDVALLVRVARAGADGDDARAALRLLHERHFDYLCEVVARSLLAPALGGEQAVIEVVDDVFEQVGRCADEFELECERDGEERARVRAWLGRIAAETALDRVQRAAPSAIPTPDAAEVLEALSTVDDPAVGALLALDEPERAPILAALAFYDSELGLSRIPGWVLDRLAARCGVARSEVRRERDRLLERIAKSARGTRDARQDASERPAQRAVRGRLGRGER